MKWLKAKWQQYIDSEQRTGREAGNSQTNTQSLIQREETGRTHFLQTRIPHYFLSFVTTSSNKYHTQVTLFPIKLKNY